MGALGQRMDKMRYGRRGYCRRRRHPSSSFEPSYHSDLTSAARATGYVPAPYGAGSRLTKRESRGEIFSNFTLPVSLP